VVVLAATAGAVPAHGAERGSACSPEGFACTFGDCLSLDVASIFSCVQGAWKHGTPPCK
jgi:hypothetical protein